MQLVRHQHIEVSLLPPTAASPRPAEVILSRAQRAHYRLSQGPRGYYEMPASQRLVK